MYICDIYESLLKFCCQRFGNNVTSIITGQELLTVYLFSGAFQRYFSIKEMHLFNKEYLLSWFLYLPFYHTLNYQLNIVNQVINEFVKHLITSFKPEDCDNITSLIDSIPIVACIGKNRIGNVATEITAKGYCSTKNMYYFGLKIDTLAFRRKEAIPFSEMLILSSTAENDLAVLKTRAADKLTYRNIFADKIYSDFSFWGDKKREIDLEMLTTVKAIKSEEPVIIQREKAHGNLFSEAVSKVRQPIEPFFNWLKEK